MQKLQIIPIKTLFQISLTFFNNSVITEYYLQGLDSPPSI